MEISASFLRDLTHFYFAERNVTKMFPLLRRWIYYLLSKYESQNSKISLEDTCPGTCFQHSRYNRKPWLVNDTLSCYLCVVWLLSHRYTCNYPAVHINPSMRLREVLCPA
jgi:hypothetical protein